MKDIYQSQYEILVLEALEDNKNCMILCDLLS